MEYISFEHNNIAAELVKQAYDTPPLAFVHSYGCQQNVNDGERIKGVLMDIGYGLCDKPEDADLILFNTCAVREHAEQRVFGNVGALKGLKEKKHDLIIGLCGCMANQKHVVEKLRKSYPYVDLVFGVDGIDTLPQLIAQKLQKHKRVLMEPAQRPVIVENIPIRRERVPRMAAHHVRLRQLLHLLHRALCARPRKEPQARRYPCRVPRSCGGRL